MIADDTVAYIQHLHNVGHPPQVFVVELSMKRPRLLDGEELSSRHKWPIEIS